jgi:hypothetical protein
MPIEPNPHDEAIDQTLAALRNAAPPEGMQARIAQRVQHQTSIAPSPSRWRNFLAARTPTAAWTRGAITGAAFAAAFTLCVMLLIQHRSSTAPQTQTSAITTTRLPSQPSAFPVDLHIQRATPSGVDRNPCANPAIVRLIHKPAASTPRVLRAAAPIAPVPLSHPAPVIPLTEQERQLVRLVRTAELASLNPEFEAKRQAEKSAEFAKFFAPPPRPPASDTNFETNRSVTPQVNE